MIFRKFNQTNHNYTSCIFCLKTNETQSSRETRVHYERRVMGLTCCRLRHYVYIMYSFVLVVQCTSSCIFRLDYLMYAREYITIFYYSETDLRSHIYDSLCDSILITSSTYHHLLFTNTIYFRLKFKCNRPYSYL